MNHLEIWGRKHVVKMNTILPVEISDDRMKRAKEQTNELKESIHELSQKVSVEEKGEIQGLGFHQESQKEKKKKVGVQVVIFQN